MYRFSGTFVPTKGRFTEGYVRARLLGISRAPLRHDGREEWSIVLPRPLKQPYSSEPQSSNVSWQCSARLPCLARSNRSFAIAAEQPKAGNVTADGKCTFPCDRLPTPSNIATGQTYCRFCSQQTKGCSDEHAPCKTDSQTSRLSAVKYQCPMRRDLSQSMLLFSNYLRTYC